MFQHDDAVIMSRHIIFGLLRQSFHAALPLAISTYILRLRRFRRTRLLFFRHAVIFSRCFRRRRFLYADKIAFLSFAEFSRFRYRCAALIRHLLRPLFAACRFCQYLQRCRCADSFAPFCQFRF